MNSLGKPKKASKKKVKKSRKVSNAFMIMKSGFFPWLVVFSVFIAIAVAFAIYQYSPNIIDSSNGFDTARRVINDSLREELLQMGIRPDLRDVIETKETYGEGESTWQVLNWVIRVPKTFDFGYARTRLENLIHKGKGQFTTTFDAYNLKQPLIIEVTVDQLLSHKLQFSVKQPKMLPPVIVEQKLPVNGVETTKLEVSQKLTNRWDRLSPERQTLDLKLQRSLVVEGLTSPPLFLSEYWEGDVVNWVINVDSRPNVDQIIANIASSTGASVSRKRNKELQKVVGCFEVSIANKTSHRITLSTFPLGRGSMAKNASEDSAVFISPLRVAFVIDDIGYDVVAAERLMNLNHNITLAILPYRPFSQDIALKAYKRGVEVITHLPMQPTSYPDVDPGQGGILLSQGPIEQQQIASDAIDAVPYSIGVNNHMGSEAMTDEKTVNAVLQIIKERDIFFIDSRTISNTLGFMMSRRMGIPTAERSVFLDSAEKNDINITLLRLDDVIKKVKVQGSCIAIGHTSLETYTAIRQYLTKFRAAGIEFVYASELVTY